jgi:hypothetical protein
MYFILFIPLVTRNRYIACEVASDGWKGLRKKPESDLLHCESTEDDAPTRGSDVENWYINSRPRENTVMHFSVWLWTLYDIFLSPIPLFLFNVLPFTTKHKRLVHLESTSGRHLELHLHKSTLANFHRLQISSVEEEVPHTKVPRRCLHRACPEAGIWSNNNDPKLLTRSNWVLCKLENSSWYGDPTKRSICTPEPLPISHCFFY